jgi:hypothetical protein
MIRLLEFQSFDIQTASKVDTGMAQSPDRERVTPGGPPALKREAVAAAYLRAAHAYILISMPTGTSTIFGVFQAIWLSLLNRTNFRPAG